MVAKSRLSNHSRNSNAHSACVGTVSAAILRGMGGRIRVAVGAAALAAAAVLIPLPSSAEVSPTISAPARPADSTRVGAGEVIPGTDMVIPPAGTPELRRPGAEVARAGAPAVYDIRVFTMATADGSVGLSDADIADMVARTDAWFARTTLGGYRFRLVGPIEVLPPYPGRVCDFTPTEEAVAPFLPLRPTLGARDAIWVGVTPDVAGSCSAIGQGNLGSPGVWMMGMRDPVHRSALLNHELGHNLGLAHSKAVVPNGDSSSWPTGATPELAEYGDALDFMGRDYMVCTWQCTTVRPEIHAHNLNLLGVLPNAGVSHVAPGDDTVVVLSPVDADEGIRVLYLPWLNRAKFVLDYRPTDHHGGSAAGPDGPGAGVVVRLVDSLPDSGPDPYSAGEGTAAFSDPVLPSSGVIRIGVGVGGQRSLPDGTTIQVLAMDAASATVRVIRPGGGSAPRLTADAVGGCGAFACRIPATKALWETGKAAYDVPLKVTDDEWLSSVQVEVRGGTTMDLEGSRPPPGVRDGDSTIPERLILPSGMHTVTVQAMDLGGKTSSGNWTLTLPTARPATEWYSYGPGLSWNWMDFERLRCWQSGQFCAGIAVRADRACSRTVARISSLAKDESVIETQTVRLGPLARGKATAMVATFSKVLERVHVFALTSLTCSRR